MLSLGAKGLMNTVSLESTSGNWTEVKDFYSIETREGSSTLCRKNRPAEKGKSDRIPREGTGGGAVISSQQQQLCNIPQGSHSKVGLGPKAKVRDNSRALLSRAYQLQTKTPASVASFGLISKMVHSKQTVYPFRPWPESSTKNSFTRSRSIPPQAERQGLWLRWASTLKTHTHTHTDWCTITCICTLH